MKDKSGNTGVIVAAVLLLIIPLAMYICAYFLLSVETTYHYPGQQTIRIRKYTSKSVAAVFRPLSNLESAMTGYDVQMEYP